MNEETVWSIRSSPSGKAWERIGITPHHGVLAPLFMLRSEKSLGIGDFFDLLPLAEWVKSVGMEIIQLLPLNDCGGETSPYSGLSAFALNPLYIHLPQLEGFSPDDPDILALSKLEKEIRVNYPALRKHKMNILAKLLAKSGEPEGFLSFQERSPWLNEYATFMATKEANDQKPWWEWNPAVKPDRERIRLFSYLQCIAYSQLEEMKRRLHALGVFLKGDIPILINRDSHDVWAHPELFNQELVAGAPPDQFSKEGQYWGFPLYNWNQTDRWWRARMEAASPLYDLYRIDHIIGFFRIFAIAKDHPPKEGFFIPDNINEALQEGREHLGVLLESSPMLPIGEDLGVVPDEVRATLTQLGIAGTKVVRWERMWKGDRRFISPAHYSPLSMTTVATHDSETLTEWWTNAPEESKLYAECRNLRWEPSLSMENRLFMLKESHQSASLLHINPLGEYLALYPELNWKRESDARINVPGTVSEKNWSIRILPTLEEINRHDALRSTLLEFYPLS